MPTLQKPHVPTLVIAVIVIFAVVGLYHVTCKKR